MKKYFLFLTFGVCSLISTSAFAQQKPAPKKTPAKTTASTKKPVATPLTKVTAGKLIAMTNGVVDIYNEQLGEIKDIATSIERHEKSIESVAKNPKTTTHGGACGNIRPLHKGMVEKFLNNAKLAPNFPEKGTIIEGIDKADKEFEIAKSKCEALNQYFSDKKYLEDDKEYSQYKILRDSLVASYDNVRLYLGKTLDLSSQAGDRAEVIILKSSPIASVVVPMKTNLSTVSQLMAKCRDENPNAEEITADIAAIRKTLEKDKVATPVIKTALKKINNGESRFERFYTYVGDALTKSENFVKVLNGETKVEVDRVLKETEEDAKNRVLKSRYNDIKNSYGNMIDVYNNI